MSFLADEAKAETICNVLFMLMQKCIGAWLTGEGPDH